MCVPGDSQLLLSSREPPSKLDIHIPTIVLGELGDLWCTDVGRGKEKRASFCKRCYEITVDERSNFRDSSSFQTSFNGSKLIYFRRLSATFYCILVALNTY